MRDTETRITVAAARGRYAGHQRRADFLSFGYESDELPEWSPLSGEWAGESIPELLGDLLDEQSEYDSDSITDAYESAALAAYYGEEN